MENNLTFSFPILTLPDIQVFATIEDVQSYGPKVGGCLTYTFVC